MRGPRGSERKICTSNYGNAFENITNFDKIVPEKVVLTKRR